MIRQLPGLDAKQEEIGLAIWQICRPLALGVLLCACIPLSPASAQVFHIKEGDFERGGIEIESNNAFQGGFPRNADRIVNGQEHGFGYAPLSWWQFKTLLGLSKPEGEGFRATRAILENVFVLKGLPENADGVSLAWFQAVEAAIHHDQTNATIFGPIVTFQAGKFSLATNPFFEKSFGRNREEGVAFVYGWQARYEVAKGIRLGVEGYGRIPDIGNAPAGEFQEHRIGPVALIEFGLPKHAREPRTAMTGPAANNGGHAELELGLLFGLTEATPDVTGKANLHLKF
jgi:hypothetical protein